MGYPMFMMGDMLVALDWDLKNVHPLLAKSWEVSPDKLTYTFKLRDDVTFCSGKKFTASDVGYSFTRLSDPSARWPFYWRRGEIDSITAADPLKVVYKLKRPHSELLVDLARFAAAIINKENVEQLGADFGVMGFDGTGPLCWESWQPRKELVLKRHDTYKWAPTGMYANKGPVKYEKMIWRIVPEDTTRIATMLSGQADFCHWNPLPKRAGKSAPYTSAGDQMYLYYHSKNRPVPNRMMWNDSETDRLLDAGRNATNDADRAAAFREVQRRMHDEALMIPSAHSRLFLVAKKSIKNVRSHGIYSAALYKGIDLQP